MSFLYEGKFLIGPSSAKNVVAVVLLIPSIDVMIFRSSTTIHSQERVSTLLSSSHRLLRCARVSTFPISMISLAGLTVATDEPAASIISSGVNVILQLPSVCLNVFAMVLGFDA